MSQTFKNRLSYLCTKVGRQIPVWTQGAGGNISIKEGDRLWIKATGYRLDEVKESVGIAHVDYKKMVAVLNQNTWTESEAEENYAKLIRETTLPGEGLGLASMETGFHALLPGKYVAHFHSLASLLLYHEFTKDRARVLKWLQQKTDLECAFVPVCRPGWILSGKIKGDASLYFLESHGIILHSDKDSLVEEWAILEKDFCKDFNYPLLYSLLTETKTFTELFQQFATKPMPFKCYFPDIAVFSERIEKILEPTSIPNHLFFPASAVVKDRDMAELWLATQLIYQMCPDFKEVPSEITSVVRDLPTEKIRRQRELNHD